MPANIRHIKHPQALRALLTSPSGGVAKDIFRRAKKVETQAKKNLQRAPRRVNTGLLRSSIHAALITVNGNLIGQVSTNVFYAIFVHEGTGIYGPKGRPIRPVTAKALSWKTADGTRVFAKSVKGMQPNPFLKDALSAAKD